MATKPTFPVLIIDNAGYLDLLYDEDYLNNCKALGLIKGFYKNFRAYDKNGTSWIADNVQSKYPINNFTKFLAYSVYNPSIKVTFSWKRNKGYELDDLKKDINNLVDKDDDIITQFVGSDVIKKAIDESHSFTDITKALNKYVFKVNEDDLYKEQHTRK